MTEEVKAAKRAAKTPPAAKRTKAAPEVEVKPGRRPAPETVEAMGKFMKLAGRKGGISNVDAASELGLSTLKVSALGRRLVAAGTLAMIKAENGRVMYQKAP